MSNAGNAEELAAAKERLTANYLEAVRWVRTATDAEVKARWSAKLAVIVSELQAYAAAEAAEETA